MVPVPMPLLGIAQAAGAIAIDEVLWTDRNPVNDKLIQLPEYPFFDAKVIGEIINLTIGGEFSVQAYCVPDGKVGAILHIIYEETEQRQDAAQCAPGANFHDFQADSRYLPAPGVGAKVHVVKFALAGC